MDHVHNQNQEEHNLMPNSSITHKNELSFHHHLHHYLLNKKTTISSPSCISTALLPSQPAINVAETPPNAVHFSHLTLRNKSSEQSMPMTVKKPGLSPKLTRCMSVGETLAKVLQNDENAKIELKKQKENETSSVERIQIMESDMTISKLKQLLEEKEQSILQHKEQEKKFKCRILHDHYMKQGQSTLLNRLRKKIFRMSKNFEAVIERWTSDFEDMLEKQKKHFAETEERCRKILADCSEESTRQQLMMHIQHDYGVMLEELAGDYYESRSEIHRVHVSKFIMWLIITLITMDAVRGMMYYRKALELQAFLNMAKDEDLMEGYKGMENSDDNARGERSLWTQCQAVAAMKFTYVVSCQQYGIDKRSGSYYTCFI
ncbi:hypothetical protein TSUD_167060 [Trifolium subterraneum]|nr:hypothetical protein TSUD_167060 [Trifolium subterraneum]